MTQASKFHTVLDAGTSFEDAREYAQKQANKQGRALYAYITWFDTVVVSSERPHPHSSISIIKTHRPVQAGE